MAGSDKLINSYSSLPYLPVLTNATTAHLITTFPQGLRNRWYKGREG